MPRARVVSASSRRRAAGARTARALAALALALTSALHAYDSARLQRAAERLGPRAQAALPALQQLLAPGEHGEEAQQISAVNAFFNRRIAFREDSQAWGVVDHWASPLEALDKGEGDCEDYAIAKYFSLLAIGVPVQRLRLVYVRAQVGGEQLAHMVLAVYPKPDAEPLILDNLIGSVRPASQRPDLTPVFSFNGEGLWQGTGPARAGDPQVRLSRWREVMAKAQAEGFF